MNPALLSFRGVRKTFTDAGGRPREVLRGVDLDVPKGGRLAVIGRSGSGKSTLLHLAAGIDVPTAGEVHAGGQDLARLSEHDRSLFRRAFVGLIFQFFHLLPHLPVRENVALPAFIAGTPAAIWEPRVGDLLDRVGLLDRAADRVEKLSGGEMQRVALCRALLSRPQLLLADEPTGNLDDANSRLVMDLLLRLSEEEGTTLVYVTHSAELAARADRVLRLHDGLLEAV